MNMDLKEKTKQKYWIAFYFFWQSCTPLLTRLTTFPFSKKWGDIRLWMWRGAAAAEEPRWGLRASCSGYRLTEASDPATTSLSKVTQAKSEHKRLFLPALLELASIKSSAGSLSLKMANSFQTSPTKTIKTLQKIHTSTPCHQEWFLYIYIYLERVIRARWICALAYMAGYKVLTWWKQKWREAPVSGLFFFFPDKEDREENFCIFHGEWKLQRGCCSSIPVGPWLAPVARHDGGGKPVSKSLFSNSASSAYLNNT